MIRPRLLLRALLAVGVMLAARWVLLTLIRIP